MNRGFCHLFERMALLILLSLIFGGANVHAQVSGSGDSDGARPENLDSATGEKTKTKSAAAAKTDGKVASKAKTEDSKADKIKVKSEKEAASKEAGGAESNDGDGTTSNDIVGVEDAVEAAAAVARCAGSTSNAPGCAGTR